MTPAQITALARENFRRIGENFACAVKTSGMDAESIGRCVEVSGAGHLAAGGQSGAGRVMVIGHFGNFEIYAKVSRFVPGYQFATTFRGLRQPGLDRLLRELREESGCLFFERRSQAAELRDAMNNGGIMIGFLVDQHAGDHGLAVPFFGEACSTSTAPAVFALRYHCPLHMAVCRRIALGRWRIEIGPAIATHENEHARSIEDITLDINRAYEDAIRQDPANWFWVHRRWKKGHNRKNRAVPPSP
jgi:KDO2-lipid IV(A) lauroyltransferase